MYTAFTDCLPKLAVGLPGCPDNLKLQTLREAWRTWCEESGTWRDVVTLDTVARQPDYALPNATLTIATVVTVTGEVVRLAHVEIRTDDDITCNRDGYVVFPDYYRVEPRGDYSIAGGTDQILGSATPPSSYTLHFLPPYAPQFDTTKGLVLWICYKPVIDAPFQAPTIFNHWAEGILAKTRALLAGYPNEQFSDAKFAVAQDKIYRRFLNRAKWAVLAQGRPATLALEA